MLAGRECERHSSDPSYGIYAYTGREWDPEIGLYYYRSRYYDPKVGRLVSEDPIGFNETRSAAPVDGRRHSARTFLTTVSVLEPAPARGACPSSAQSQCPPFGKDWQGTQWTA
ncbi:MAG: RHS repeat-associated core domain-containing protein [Acidobacteria bacterium]|nr:RHS repeat-associated core domain-containing protein [Acidobacteriota bacterium]